MFSSERRRKTLGRNRTSTARRRRSSKKNSGEESSGSRRPSVRRLQIFTIFECLHFLIFLFQEEKMRAVEAERLRQEAEKLAEQERIRKGKNQTKLKSIFSGH